MGILNFYIQHTLLIRYLLAHLTDVVIAPNVLNLHSHVFGCVAFMHLHKHQCNKLTSHALRCVFDGYALHQKGYRCYCRVSRVNDHSFVMEKKIASLPNKGSM